MCYSYKEDIRLGYFQLCQTPLKLRLWLLLLLLVLSKKNYVEKFMIQKTLGVKFRSNKFWVKLSGSKLRSQNFFLNLPLKFGKS